MPLDDVVLADDHQGLVRGLDGLADLGVVAVDVERADWDRYFRVAALIQVGGRGRVVLVDPLALDDLSALQRFLAGRVAVLHAMENDLTPLAACGVHLEQVEDTSIAAALLGLPIGLDTLLRDLLGVELQGDKQAMQRADWEARPLTTAMLAYAAGDVADLPALWEELARRLTEAERVGWYREELEATLRRPASAERRAWTKTKGVGRLDPRARARARALWEARESLARTSDTAPGRILGDRALVDLATRPVASTRELARRGMRRQAVRQFGDDLLSALEAPAAPEADGVVPWQGQRPTDEERAAAEALRDIRARRAEELGLDPGVLCPNRVLLTAVLTRPATPEDLRAALGLRLWQWEQLGHAFCDALELDGPGKPPATDDRAEGT